MRFVRLMTAVLIGAIVAGCSTNPATGRREFNIVSEQQEQAIGEQAHREVLEQFGVYDEKPELNMMVTEIGRKVALVSDRPNLPWRFTLLDSPMVNAMAIPGGYVYITRGILERMNSEDELAGVIAHEVAHVAARHSAQRMSQAQLAQFGLILGSAIAGPAATEAYGSLAQLGAILLFQRYSRAQETQADLLGTAYMTEAGYNPLGAEKMLLVLQRLDRGETSSLDQYFRDHPDPGKRVNDVRTQIRQLQQGNVALARQEPERNSFVRKLEGMITGASTLQTTIRANTIYQRKYGMVLPVPNGWRASTGFGGLFQMAPPKTHNVGVTAQEVPLRRLQGTRNVELAIRRGFEQMGLRYLDSRTASARTGERFTVDLWAGQTQRGNVAVETTHFVEGDHVVVIMQLTDRLRRGESPLSATLGSMSFDRARARDAEPARLRIGTSRPGETWTAVATRATGRTADAEEVAELNGYDPKSSLPASLLLKLPEETVPDLD